MKRIALVGNPNSGKSTLFNALTGATQFIGNWPGVTVEKKTGSSNFDGEKVRIVDLPGIYSLSPYSNEEIISRDYILNEKPEAVINIVDASNLERNLYLTTQVLELGVPVVVALNMIDVVNKKGEKLDPKALSLELGCPVVEISAVTKFGLGDLKEACNLVTNENYVAKPSTFSYQEDVKEATKEVNGLIEEANGFEALKVLANDKHMVETLKVSEEVLATAETLRTKLEEKYDDDFESIIAEQRYAYINRIIDKVILKRRKEKVSLSDKIDRVVTNKWAALPIFFLIIYAIYWLCLNPEGLAKQLVGITFGFVGDVMGWVGSALESIGTWAWLNSLVVNGVIFGLGLVLAFIPYVMVLFVCLAILEECGYMARVAFIMDRIFRRFGLSGKSFIPMLLGTGCTVQAVASVRAIEQASDRKMTVFLTPFMPCATKMPVIIAIVGVISTNAWVAPLTYLIAIVFIILGGLLLKKTVFKGEPAPFVMELPEYKLPRLKNIWHFVWDKTLSFFRKATTIIFVSTVVIWFLQYFTFTFEVAKPDLSNSMLASIGHGLSWLFAPLGFGDYRLVASMITGFVAKENFLITLGTFLGAGKAGTEQLLTLINPAQAVSLLLFFILSSPCFASMGAMKKELGSAKLTAGAIGFQMGTAYVVSLIIFNILRWFF